MGRQLHIHTELDCHAALKLLCTMTICAPWRSGHGCKCPSPCTAQVWRCDTHALLLLQRKMLCMHAWKACLGTGFCYRVQGHVFAMTYHTHAAIGASWTPCQSNCTQASPDAPSWPTNMNQDSRGIPHSCKDICMATASPRGM